MKKTMIETGVTYALEHGGKFYLIEQVAARVCRETGEQCFALKTVERIQALIRSKKPPKKVIETPVYEYAYRCSTITLTLALKGRRRRLPLSVGQACR